ALVIAGKDWSAGVVGLVASRLVEKYRWPTVLLSEQGEVCVGSARSIPGVNIYQAMRACAHLFTRFGGHAQAAGVTLPTQNVPAFRVALSDAIAAQAQADTFMPLEMYDLPLTLPEVTVEWVEQLAGLQPTGFGNPAPTFCLRGAQVASFRCVGRAQAHLQLQLRQADCLLGGIAFRQGRQAETLPDCVDALFTPTLNEWNGKRIPQCEVQRLLPHAADEAFEALCAREDEAFARESLTQLHQCMDDRQACALPLETPDGLRERIAAALRAGCQGLLLIVYTRQGVRDALSWLRAEGLTDRLDYRLGMAEDVRGFHTLCALPNFAAWTTHFTDL
ncbi:MAG: DHHA1 domain-containing protein, partial [Clostridia bacterium]